MKKIFYAFLISLGILINYSFVKSPNVQVYKEKNTIILENIFLGEYYLGLNQLSIQSIPDYTLICKIKPPHYIFQEDNKQQIILKKGLNNIQSIWSSESKSSEQPTCILENKTYLISVWGNNGSGFSTRKNLIITIP